MPGLLLASRWPNLLSRTGDPRSPGAYRETSATASPPPSPSAHLAGRIGRVLRCPGATADARFDRGATPDLAQPVARPGRRDRVRRVGRAGVEPAAHDRAPRRPGAARPGGPLGGTVPDQPAERVRRPARAAVHPPIRPSSWRRCGLAGGIAGGSGRPDHRARRVRVLDQHLVQFAVPAPLLGRDVSGPDARPGRRVPGDGPGGRGRGRGPRRRGDRRPARWSNGGRARRARRGRRARWRMRVCVCRPRRRRSATRLANPSGPCGRVRRSSGWRWHRGSLAAGSSPRVRSSPWCTWTGWTCRSRTSASSACSARPRRRSRSWPGARSPIASTRSPRCATAASSDSPG